LKYQKGRHDDSTSRNSHPARNESYSLSTVVARPAASSKRSRIANKTAGARGAEKKARMIKNTEHDFWAHVTSHDRRLLFESLIGTNTVPIKSPIAQTCDLPGKPASLVYLVDVTFLNDEERQVLAHYLASEFATTADEILDDFDKTGVLPIRAEDCLIEIRRPARWFC
jgi:hypothetical protein